VSEPKEVAHEIVEVAAGVWHWRVWDDRIGAESHAHALASRDGTVLIDPLPLAPEVLRRLEPIAATLLTAACHQRSAWRYRRSHGVVVHAPEATRPMEEEPDFRYRAGQELPGGIVALHTPGPELAHYAFWREASPAVVVCADLMMREDDGAPEFVPPEYHDDPAATHDSLRRLLQLPFDVFCMAHGEPFTSNRRNDLQKLLRDS
jgi:glyoxylase-like metal-dependent hydrolase (beta-lactamase superfamily II)